MFNANVQPITKLTVGGSIKTTDVYPAVDTTDTTQSPTGTTKKYSVGQLLEFIGATSGSSFKVPCRATSYENPLNAIYNNGIAGVGATLTNNDTLAILNVDNINMNLNDRVLIAGQTDTTQNGIFVVTNPGSASVAWILTRASDYDNSIQGEIIEGNSVLVTEGNFFFGSIFYEYGSGPFVVGATPILFQPISVLASIQAGLNIQFLQSGTTTVIDTTGAASFTWFVLSEPNNLLPFAGYITNSSSLLTFTLPNNAQIGDTYRIVWGPLNGGWSIAQNSGQYIQCGNAATTTGVGGSLSSTAIGNSIEIVCTQTDPNTFYPSIFTVVSSQGNFTII